MPTHLTNCHVIDCISPEADPYPATVIIEEGAIAVIDQTNATPPAEATVFDMGGAYLMPGLWDMHCHPSGMIPDPEKVSYFETEAAATLRAVRNTTAALRKGITALRPVGEANFIDVALRETYANRTPGGLWHPGYADKRLYGPRIFPSGPAFIITGGHATNGRIEPVYNSILVEVDGPAEIRKAVRHAIKMGVDWIKLCITGGVSGSRESMYEIQMSHDEIATACEVAHNKGLKVTAHTGCAEAAKMGIEAGLDCIEHGYQLDEEACAMMVASDVYYCPTISVTQDEAYMRRWGWPEHSVRRALEGAELHKQALQTALAAGVKIVNGADLNPIADTAIPEIEWVVNCGMTPGQALCASTRNPAELCEVDDQLGTVEVGKLADLIATPANPLEDISALREVKFVMQEGTVIVNELTR